MSDENQPDDVVESTEEAELLPLDAEPTGSNAEDAEATPQPEAELEVQGEPEPVGASSEDAPTKDAPPEDVPPEDVPPEDTPVVEITAADEVSEDEGVPEALEVLEPEPLEEDEVPLEAGAVAEAVAFEDASTPADEALESAAPASVTPSMVSLGDLEEVERGGSVLTRARELFAAYPWAIAVVVGLLLVVFLLLPPVSLIQRVQGAGGFTALDATTESVQHPDGLTVTRLGDLEGRVRVKLGSIPRAEFVKGAVPEDLTGAVEAIPDYLVPKSPFYTIQIKAKTTVPAVLTVVIPNEAEPWETLSLYAWTGDRWQWLPTTLDMEREVLTASVEELPGSVMVMQTAEPTPYVAVEVDTWPLEPASAVVNEADVTGIFIGTLGGLTGYVDHLPPAASEGAKVVPLVRNWMPGHEPNWALVSDMLRAEEDRDAHIANLLGAVQQGGYPGLVVDYRAVLAEDRDLYTAFIQGLADAFHEAGLWLAVVVDTPRSTAGQWETGAYDLRALGAAADQVRIVMPLSPQAYVPGGEAEQLLQWATTQIERHRIVPIFSTLSTDGERPVTMAEALSTVGAVEARTPITDSVTPGTSLAFALAGGSRATVDAEIQTTRIEGDGQVFWLGTPQWLVARLDLAKRYRLGGITLRDLYTEGNVPGLLAALESYIGGGTGGAPTVPEVQWEVSGPSTEGAQATTSLEQPAFTWVAPAVTGTYRIAASVAGIDKGSIEVLVAEPQPTVTETTTIEETAESPTEEGGLGGGEEEPTEAETLKAGFVADVTVPDNTRFEKGEQFTKTWRLRNSGAEPWPETTRLVFTGGAELAAVQDVEVGAVEPGATVDISVDMTAPQEDGSYKSNWALQAEGKTIPGGEIYVLIQVGEPAVNVPVAPAPVAAGGFELGGHVRNLGLPYKDKMHYAGMNWVKIQVHYGEGASGFISTAHANGFKVQLSALGGPEMVVQPGFEDNFAAWVAQLAAAGADAIEVWNEPNIDREWQIGHISPQAYTSLLCKAYSAIKAANPGTAVISAAPAPTGYFGGCGPNGCDDQPWLEGLYNAGAVNCMDYIGAHHNAGATSPSASTGHPADQGGHHHSWYFLPQTQLYYNIFRGARQLFYTEMGYASQEGVPPFSDQFGWARGTDNAEQAAWLAEAVQLSVNTGMVRCIIVWNIDFVRYGYDPQDGYAIIRPDGSCPACESLHAVLGTR